MLILIIYPRINLGTIITITNNSYCRTENFYSGYSTNHLQPYHCLRSISFCKRRNGISKSGKMHWRITKSVCKIK